MWHWLESLRRFSFPLSARLNRMSSRRFTDARGFLFRDILRASLNPWEEASAHAFLENGNATIDPVRLRV